MKSLEKARNQLEVIRQRPNQSLEDLCQEVKTLAYAVYANSDVATQESECKRAFIRALKDSNLSYQLGGREELTTMEKMLAKAVQLREVTQMITPEVVSKSVRQAVADIVNDLGKEVDEPEMLEQLRAFGLGPGAASSAAGRPPQSGQ